MRSANWRSHSTASAGVKNALSFNAGGRSSGVAVAENVTVVVPELVMLRVWFGGALPLVFCENDNVDGDEASVAFDVTFNVT